MVLKELLGDVEITSIYGDINIEILHLAHHDKDCENGTLFFSIKGEKVDGKNFVLNAIKNGAKAIVTQEYLNINVPQIIVKDVRSAMAIIAKNFFGRSCDRLHIIGITGSNGKTSCTYLLGSILQEQGINYGIIGTNGAKYLDQELYYGMTTPDPIIMHSLFHQLEERGATHVIMEVSAHAIALKKMEGIQLDIGVLTNITYEHIDFFRTFDAYAKTKMNYFNSKNMLEAVVNVDQSFGVYIAKHSGISCVSYGQTCPANTFAVDIEMSLSGMQFIVNSLDDILYISTSLVGIYNVYNILACISTAKLLSIPTPVIARGIENCRKIDGRFEVVKYKDATIVVDFAHTPDGFEQILSFAKQFTRGKLMVLFGTTYYANSEKCRQMGGICDKYADEIILTADNPDRTSVHEINQRIIKGIEKTPYVEIDKREEAISYAIQKIEKDDMLLCLGKGAEQYQKINGELVAYNELVVIRNLIS